MGRRGTILLATLVIIALSTLAAATLMFRARAEITAAVSSTRQHQAYAAAMSGLQRAFSVLKVYARDRQVWYDNPDLFRNQFVCDDGINRWYYTIYAYNPFDDQVLRNGLDDEASRINLNTAAEDTLLALPGMTADLVDCLMDYRDRDADTRPEGAEQDYYDQLPYPYLIKNGPLGTMEELLLVKGFDALIVYGEDYNLNSLLEKNEDDGDESFPPDNRDGRLDRGLAGSSTVWSYGLDVDYEGNPRVNMMDARALEGVGLRRQTAEYIQTVLADGGRFTDPSELLEAQYTLQRENRQLKLQAGQTISSGVGPEELPLIMDKLTARPGGGRRAMTFGLVNLNTAAVEVLEILPGFTQDIAQRIAAIRGDLSPELLETTAWPYTENVVTADEFRVIAPGLTARSYQFRVRCVAFGWPCGQFRVIEAILDFASQTPRIMYQRDLTRLGVPFVIEADLEEK